MTMTCAMNSVWNSIRRRKKYHPRTLIKIYLVTQNCMIERDGVGGIVHAPLFQYSTIEPDK